MSTDARGHWNAVYGSKRAEELSWFQPHARVSLELARLALPDKSAPILDVGGGASRFVDDLLADGYRRITVLDLAPAGLALTRARLGAAAAQVTWVEADALSLPLPDASVDLWHDRAVFHFLTAPEERTRYVEQVRRVVRPGGFVLVATFASDAPPRCSGLPVVRYDPEDLHRVFGPDFEPVAERREVHLTPGGNPQPFTYCLYRFAPQPQGQKR